MDHYQEFPFEEHRKNDGNYFSSVKEATDQGWAIDQIWSVVECYGTYTFGPSYHLVNLIGYVATTERHDGDTYYTYYHEFPEEEDTDE